ncbi:MAG: twin transmembrane helix small protein [Robiginitomaculum sp.]|nr:twin transmembrane helix small protein [Robiginitomaculum sp.]
MFLNILMAGALLTVAVTLVLGMINMLKTDKAAQLKSNKLMRMRVMAQAVAICILMLALYLKKNAGS